MRTAIVVMVAALLGAGCGGRSETGTAASKDPVLARWRFVGGQTLRGQSNAPAVRDLMTLPEAAGVGSRLGTNLTRLILDRIPGSPGRAAEGQLYPLVQAVLDHESAGEITSSGWVVAIRAGDLPAAAMGQALALLPRPGGATAPATLVTNGWWMAASSPAALAKSAGLPAATPGGVLNGEFDLPTLLGAGHEALPSVNLSVGTSNATVRTSATLKFAKAPLGELEAWKVPDEFMRDPLIRFSALRGTGPLIDSVEWLRSLAGGAAPGQVVSWAQSGVTFRNWFAVPVEDTATRIEKIHSNLQPYFGTTNDPGRYTGRLVVNSNRSAVTVFDLKACFPMVGAVKQNGQSFLLTSFIPGEKSDRRVPAELLGQINRTNLAFYEWEITGESARNWNVLAQFNQLSQRRAPNPIGAKAFRWMLASTPKLGNAVTQLERRTPTEYLFTRKSDIGLNGLELVLLTRWIDDGFPILAGKVPALSPPLPVKP